MKTGKPLHDWDLSPADAVLLQHRLVQDLLLAGSPRARLVAGVDCSCARFSTEMWAGIVVFDLKEDRVVERVTAAGTVGFPYIPGFLSFREGPLVLEAWSRLQTAPDAVLFDGQGIAHPRGLGLASHLGLWLGLSTVGCAKSRLCGEAPAPAEKAGSRTSLILEEKVVGAALRTKVGCKPLFISPGHLIDLDNSIKLVMDCCRGYRLPEPTRLAHLLVNEARRQGKGGQG